MRFMRGLSMVEIMVAVVIIALAVGPLIGLLSSSSRMSNASIYEEMAVHYSREIADQLLRLGPQFPAIVNDARTLTGDVSLNLASILNDSSFRDQMEVASDSSAAIPLQVAGSVLPVRLMLSPLDKAFSRRRITLADLDTSANSLLKVDKFWKVTIEMAWKDSNAGADSHRETVMVVILKEG